MRGSMLLLAFAYMLYATIEWKVRSIMTEQLRGLDRRSSSRRRDC